MIGFGQTWKNTNYFGGKFENTLFKLGKIDTVTIINFKKDKEIINNNLPSPCMDCTGRELYWQVIWEIRFYDELLNYYYNIMKSSIKPSIFNHFQNSQRSWISSRDEFWECIDKDSAGWAAFKVDPILLLYKNRVNEMLNLFGYHISQGNTTDSIKKIIY
tara:strand:- start:97 stop:576 length:480 start_codon:yes stop_codon:yes gene_type:complete